MALIKCPECGKENISDAAATCPVCGYGIKKYFERIRQEEAFSEKEKIDQEKIQKQYDDELKRIDEMCRPYKPSWLDIILQKEHWMFVLSCSLTLLVLLCIILSLFGLAEEIDFVMILLGVFFGFIAYMSWKDIKKEYDSAVNKYKNWEEYKEKLKNDALTDYETKISNLESSKFEPQKNITSPEKVITPQPSYGLKCPICGSRDVKRIDIVSRAISVELVGLASSKIGKQYECKNCKHKW